MEDIKPEQHPDHFDPTDELSEQEVNECIKRAELEVEATNDRELNLSKSEIKVNGQEWVLVSFVGEDLGQKTKELGMKVWGTFPSIEEAKAHADKINKDSDHKIFDVYILEMYCWAMIPPKKDYIEDQTYHEDKLHEIITERKRQQTIAKEVFETRKEKLAANVDRNEFENNKDKLSQLMGAKLAIDDKLDKYKVGGELHTSVFGEPEKLPKVEILDEDDNIVSVSQGLTESDEDYAVRKKKMLEQYESKKMEKMGVIEESETTETEHNEKFYNK